MVSFGKLAPQTIFSRFRRRKLTHPSKNNSYITCFPVVFRRGSLGTHHVGSTTLPRDRPVRNGVVFAERLSISTTIGMSWWIVSNKANFTCVCNFGNISDLLWWVIAGWRIRRSDLNCRNCWLFFRIFTLLFADSFKYTRTIPSRRFMSKLLVKVRISYKNIKIQHRY